MIVVVSVIVMKSVGLDHGGGHRGGRPDGHCVSRGRRHCEGVAGWGGGGGLGSRDDSWRLWGSQQRLGVRVLVVSCYWGSLR